MCGPIGIICKLTYANDKDKDKDNDKDNDKAKAEKLTGNSCRKVAKGKGKSGIGGKSLRQRQRQGQTHWRYLCQIKPIALSGIIARQTSHPSLLLPPSFPAPLSVKRFA